MLRAGALFVKAGVTDPVFCRLASMWTSGGQSYLTRPAPSWLRWPVLLACAGVAIYLLKSAAADFSLHDVDAYWNAALRIRHGEPIYLATTDIQHFDVYRYAPWFAYAWVPLTYLPREAVDAVWFGLLLGASLAVSAGAARRGVFGIGLALLLGPLLVWTAVLGNVHPLVVASLFFGVERRSGPIWIALAASLKAAPIVLILVYLGRREWVRAGMTLIVFALLVAPMLWLPGYTADPGLTLSLYGWVPVLYFAVALIAMIGAFALAKTRWAWLAGALAIVATLPRLWIYDLSFLLLGTRSTTGGGLVSGSRDETSPRPG